MARESPQLDTLRVELPEPLSLPKFLDARILGIDVELVALADIARLRVRLVRADDDAALVEMLSPARRAPLCDSVKGVGLVQRVAVVGADNLRGRE